MLIYSIITTVASNSYSTITNDHQTHTMSSIADQVETIYPNLQQSLPTKQNTRLKKDPKFLSDQVEVFSNKKQIIQQVPGKDDDKSPDDKPQKFVSSRPLFVYRKEQRQKERENDGFYDGVHTNVYHSYPSPYLIYTNHGVYHYYPYGR